MLLKKRNGPGKPPLFPAQEVFDELERICKDSGQPTSAQDRRRDTTAATPLSIRALTAKFNDNKAYELYPAGKPQGISQDYMYPNLFLI